MADKYKKPSFYVLSFSVGLGLGLILVGIFTGVTTCVSEIEDLRGTISLFDEDFSTFGISNVFALLSFVLTVVGAVLILVSGMLLANDIEDALVEYAITSNGGGLTNRDQLEAALRAVIEVKAGTGVWLGFIGGLIAAIASGVSMLKRFMPDAPTNATAAADAAGGSTADAVQPPVTDVDPFADASTDGASPTNPDSPLDAAQSARKDDSV